MVKVRAIEINASTAAQTELSQKTPLTDAVHANARASVFQTIAQPTARYSTYFEEVAYSDTSLGVPLDPATNTIFNKIFVKKGDRIGGMWARVTGPLLAAVTTAATAFGGATGGGSIRMLVDDIHQQMSQIRYVTAHADAAGGIITAGTAISGRLLKLSSILTANQAEAVGTFTTAFKDSGATLAHVIAPYFNRMNTMPKYCDYAGATFIQKATLHAATETLAEVTPLDIICAEEFFPKFGKKQPGRLMNHGSEAQRIVWAQSEFEWLIPLPFWFARGEEALSFNFAAAYGQDVGLSLEVMSPLSLIEGIGAQLTDQTAAMATAPSSGTPLLLRTTADGTLGAGLTPLGSTGIVPPSTALTASMFQVSLVMQKYRVLDAERGQFVNESSTKIITVNRPWFDNQTYTNSDLTDGSGTAKTVAFLPKLNFLGGVWVAHKTSEKNQNRHNNFSGARNPLYPDAPGRNMFLAFGIKWDADYILKMSPSTLIALMSSTAAHEPSTLEGLHLVLMDGAHPYGVQKGNSVPLVKISNPSVEFTPDPYAAAPHQAEGGLNGESLTLRGRAWCTQLLVTGGGGVYVKYMG